MAMALVPGETCFSPDVRRQATSVHIARVVECGILCGPSMRYASSASTLWLLRGGGLISFVFRVGRLESEEAVFRMDIYIFHLDE